MKVVKVKHYERDFFGEVEKHFLFETPIKLKEGDIVLTAPKQSKDRDIAICAADNIEISEKILEYLASVSEYELPLAEVIGKYELTEWGEVNE